MQLPEQADGRGLVLPVRVDPDGITGPTRAQARSRNWRRAFRGYFVPAEVDADKVEQRIWEASVLVPPNGAITGWAALRWLGGHWFDGLTDGGRSPSPVPIATAGRTARPQPGVTICEEGLNPADRIQVSGLWVTSAVRSACFEMRYTHTVEQAVAILDMAAYSDLVSRRELADYAASKNGWTGIPRCREAIPWTDENAWSPPEVSMRLTWTTVAGLPRPLTNIPIFDTNGRHAGTPDLFDPAVGLVGEYDGYLHFGDGRRGRDIDRNARYRSLGLEVVGMSAGDLRDTGPFVARLHQAYARARAGSGPRGWTITPPSFWIPTRTVEARRALTPAQRELWLGYRSAA